MTEPEDERAAAAGGRGRLRASRMDRERVIELLKVAFVQDRLTHDELDTRVGLALASRTYADLADLTADIPADVGCRRACRWACRYASPDAYESGPQVGDLHARPARPDGGHDPDQCEIPGAHGPSRLRSLRSSRRRAFWGTGWSTLGRSGASTGSCRLPPRRDGRGLEGGRPGSTGRDPGSARSPHRPDPRRPARTPTGPAAPIRVGFPGATWYAAHPGRRITGPGHNAPLRALPNRRAGIWPSCLRARARYDEATTRSRRAALPRATHQEAGTSSGRLRLLSNLR